MEINRAQELAKQYGYKLKLQAGFLWDLFDDTGGYVDTLHLHQIGVLLEDDFIEYYLND